MSDASEAELAALRIVLSNVVARLATSAGPRGSPEIREMLRQMRDECQMAAERAPQAGADSGDQILRKIDEFFKAITIT
jgi:hypothetical protein